MSARTLLFWVVALVVLIVLLKFAAGIAKLAVFVLLALLVIALAGRFFRRSESEDTT